MNALIAALVIVAAALGVVSTWRNPPALVGAALTASLFVRTIDHFTSAAFLGSLDDVFVMVVILRAVIYRIERSNEEPFIRSFPGFAFALTFAGFGLISAFLNAVPFGTVALGSYLATKAIFFGWAVAQFQWTAGAVRASWRWGCAIAAVIALAMLLNLAIPGRWAAAFSVSGAQIERYGLPSLFGPFVHPFDLAFACSVLAVAAAAYLRVFGRRNWAIFALVVGLVGTVLSLRRKDLLGIAAGLFTLVARLNRPGWLIAGALVLPILLVWNWSFLSHQVSELLASYASLTSREARTVLTLGGIHLAVSDFPFGAGFGRFASRAAAVNYSPEYYKLGINNTYGLGPGVGQGAFLTDTSWPALLGEAGFVGTSAFVGMLVAFLIASRRWARSDSAEMRWVGLTGVSLLVVILFESTGASVFASPPMFPFLPALIGIGASLERTIGSSMNSTAALVRSRRRL